MKFIFFFTIIYFSYHPLFLSACPPDQKKSNSNAIEEINLLLDEKKQNIQSAAPSKPSPWSTDKRSHILVLGGGYSPSGNQVSLESNVKYFRKIRSKLGLDEAPMHTYFADGKEKGRDLQFYDPDFAVPQVNLILAELFGKTKGISNQYRSNKLLPDGTASIPNLDKWLSQRKKSDLIQKNIIYFTGHGGKGDSKNPHNTTAYLWSNSRLKVNELVKKLDELPLKQSTILVMVQCYSGGFANILFQDGDPKKGVSKHARAGFFSTVQNRVAAGCTPDIREENYQEYSTSFWEALSGQTRTGSTIIKPDYNADGKTSLIEAHSYVSIHSNTIDIPIKTSDILLRKYLPDEFKKKEPGKKVSDLIEKYLPKVLNKNTSDEQSLDPDTLSKSTLFKLANHEQRAVFLGLSKILGLKQEIPVIEIKELQEKLKKEREGIQKEKKKALDQKNKYRDELRKKLLAEHPEISNPYHPRTTQLLLINNKQKVLDIVQNNNTWEKLVQQKEKSEKYESERFVIEKKEVKTMRLHRCIENIILTKTLEREGTVEENKNYSRLLTLERTIFVQ